MAKEVPIVGNDYDEVPMDVKIASDLKLALAEANTLANVANKTGIDLVKAISIAAQVGDRVFEKEQAINKMLENAAAVSGVTKDQFVGFDLERATVRVKKPVVN